MLQKKIIEEDAKKIISESLPWERLYGKTVLLSGANGYVPSYFVHAFLALNDAKQANIKVIALCRSKERAAERFGDFLGRRNFVLQLQDVCDFIELDEKIQYFIHAASPAGIYARHSDPVATFAANVMGCDHMLQLAIKNPCEGFLFISSVDVYGRMQSAARLEETDSGILNGLNIRNVYSCAKRAAETLCRAYYAKYRIPIFIARPFQIFGPGPALDDGRLHIDFITQMLAGNRIVLKSDGSAKRTFLYITDAITGMLTVLLKGKDGEAYNIVHESGEASVLELARLMAALVFDRKIDIAFDYEKRNSIEVTGALPVVAGSSDKLCALGWNAKLSLAEGAERMMRYYGIKTNRRSAYAQA